MALTAGAHVGSFAARLQDRARAVHVSPTALAWLALARGEADRALVHVQRAAAIRDPLFAFWRMWPLAASDDRIERVLRRIEL